jgi:hypothetical protein
VLPLNVSFSTSFSTPGILDESVTYPWDLAETRECGAFGVGCTAGFDVSQLKRPRGVIVIFGREPLERGFEGGS